MYTYFQVSDFVKKKASFKIQEVILQLYNPTKAAFQTCNHSWSIKAPSSRQYSTSVSLNRLFNATIAWNKVKFTCNKYTIHLHWESNVHSIYNSLYAYLLQSNQVKRIPQDSISELIIWKMNPLVVPITGVKFKAAFLHA